MQEIKKVLDNIYSLHRRILRNKFAEEVTDKEITALVAAEDIIQNCIYNENGDWIPAKNKPDEDAFYVATMSGTLVGQEVPFVGLAEFEDGEWVDGDDVIAWMPLPEPYCPEAKAPERKQEWKERMLRNFMRKSER